jgi:hypothetical protein
MWYASLRPSYYSALSFISFLNLLLDLSFTTLKRDRYLPYWKKKKKKKLGAIYHIQPTSS